MSRLKLLLLVLIIAALGIVFIQNREPLALKILCPDITQSCRYQTPSLPLAVWIFLFALGGIITSLLGQMLNRYRYSGSTKRKYVATNDAEDQRQSWSRRDSMDRVDSYQTDSYSTTQNEDNTSYSKISYEKPQEPESIERSGSTYSYKYKDKKGENNGVSKTSADSASDINLNKDDDEDWI